MDLFDKMKSGLNQVKDMASQTVEVSKLHTQIFSKKRDIQHHYEQLGEIVYRASGMSPQSSIPMSEGEQRMTALCREISVMEMQLIQLEQELKIAKQSQK